MRSYNAVMPDLLYLVLTVAFFAACAGFVTLCDRIIGPDADHGDPQGAGEPDPEVEAEAEADADADADLATTRGAS